MDKGSIGTIILMVAIIVAIIAEMAYRQVMDTLRREGKEINRIDQFAYLFKYRKVINAGYLRDEESKSAYRLYVKTSAILLGIILIGLLNIFTNSFIITM
jgi:hypothetical protein